MPDWLIKLGVFFVFCVVFGLIQGGITNPLAQKNYPTYESDSGWRRYKYHLVHVLVVWGTVAIPLLVIGFGLLFITGKIH